MNKKVSHSLNANTTCMVTASEAHGQINSSLQLSNKRAPKTRSSILLQISSKWSKTLMPCSLDTRSSTTTTTSWQVSTSSTLMTMVSDHAGWWRRPCLSLELLRIVFGTPSTLLRLTSSRQTRQSTRSHPLSSWLWASSLKSKVLSTWLEMSLDSRRTSSTLILSRMATSSISGTLARWSKPTSLKSDKNLKESL